MNITKSIFRGLLIVVSGPSGAGKGSICEGLLERRKDCLISVSATTRQPRPGETEGISYFFKTKEQFESEIADGKFLEHAHVYGNYYGTPKNFVEEQILNGKNVILEIDIQGAEQVRDLFEGAVFVFVMPPSMDELTSRIKNRGTESASAISERMGSATKEIEELTNYDFFLINDDLERSVNNLSSIITAERLRVHADADQLIQKFKEGRDVTTINRRIGEEDRK